ncbi:MAG: protein adenylyltransferase SelO family protein, partial [Cyanobacteria bacterium J06638_7]
PVSPNPLPDPVYIAHSSTLFRELGLSDELAQNPDFRRIFSGDLSDAPAPMRPFGSGNGYGDCRAVLRSSVREFLAQEHRHALGIPTSRSLTLHASSCETVVRPWYAPESRSSDPGILLKELVAISTRVAPSFLRVGYCQGNFNRDNCAAGGFTLDYGPFGFCECFDPAFQAWTGGGDHFAFFNQPVAAAANFHMVWTAVRPLLVDHPEPLARFDGMRQGFAEAMESRIQAMWTSKLGLTTDDPALVQELLQPMLATQVDYTLPFRELSQLPQQASALTKTVYTEPSEPLEARWQAWLQRWRDALASQGHPAAISARMKQVNPAVSWREWLVVPAYQQAGQGDDSLVRELQDVLTHPYDEPSPDIEARYCRLRPEDYFHAGGVSHHSCSS